MHRLQELARIDDGMIWELSFSPGFRIFGWPWVSGLFAFFMPQLSLTVEQQE
jgi:hypothetical protein